MQKTRKYQQLLTFTLSAETDKNILPELTRGGYLIFIQRLRPSLSVYSCNSVKLMDPVE